MLRKILLILSLIGFIASLGMWVMSYWKPGWNRGDLHIRLAYGALTAFDVQEHHVKSPREGWDVIGYTHMATIWLPSLHLTPQYPNPHVTIHWGFAVPLWIPATVFGGIGGRVYYVNSRRRRLRAGLCVACGYDLRGSVDRCSECATPFERLP